MQVPLNFDTCFISPNQYFIIRDGDRDDILIMNELGMPEWDDNEFGKDDLDFSQSLFQ